MTEDEAKTKLCHVPFLHIQDPNNTKEPVAGNCIGSECMAWREITKKISSGTASNLFVKYEVVGGYCGLAGKP